MLKFLLRRNLLQGSMIHPKKFTWLRSPTSNDCVNRIWKESAELIRRSEIERKINKNRKREKKTIYQELSQVRAIFKNQ